MITLRCTNKLRKYLGISPLHSPAEPMAKLGDWYANLIPTAGGDLILCASEKSLLTVAIPARESDNLAGLFQIRVANLLGMIGISYTAIVAEISHYDQIQIGKTANKSLLGSMNNFAQMYQYKAEEFTDGGFLSLSNAELDMSEVPCKSLKFASPDMVARELLDETGRYAGNLRALGKEAG